MYGEDGIFKSIYIYTVYNLVQLLVAHLTESDLSELYYLQWERHYFNLCTCVGFLFIFMYDRFLPLSYNILHTHTYSMLVYTLLSNSDFQLRRWAFHFCKPIGPCLNDPSPRSLLARAVTQWHQKVRKSQHAGAKLQGQAASLAAFHHLDLQIWKCLVSGQCVSLVDVIDMQQAEELLL